MTTRIPIFASPAKGWTPCDTPACKLKAWFHCQACRKFFCSHCQKTLHLTQNAEHARACQELPEEGFHVARFRGLSHGLKISPGAILIPPDPAPPKKARAKKGKGKKEKEVSDEEEDGEAGPAVVAVSDWRLKDSKNRRDYSGNPEDQDNFVLFQIEDTRIVMKPGITVYQFRPAPRALNEAQTEAYEIKKHEKMPKFLKEEEKPKAEEIPMESRGIQTGADGREAGIFDLGEEELDWEGPAEELEKEDIAVEKEEEEEEKTADKHLNALLKGEAEEEKEELSSSSEEEDEESEDEGEGKRLVPLPPGAGSKRKAMSSPEETRPEKRMRFANPITESFVRGLFGNVKRKTAPELLAAAFAQSPRPSAGQVMKLEGIHPHEIRYGPAGDPRGLCIKCKKVAGALCWECDEKGCSFRMCWFCSVKLLTKGTMVQILKKISDMGEKDASGKRWCVLKS
eukprot:gb/GEZN01008091.1/.p1 GENE.gb/GEZN01008091.1/~~gb/GEZN01008091.1/.p1  ORF type:complete len:455 (+),score=97.02 gb/GEZN01008091.1/:38-1402(+)